MISLKITDIKSFMSKLLNENDTTFDTFLVAEATIVTYNTFHIDGHINHDFFDDDSSPLVMSTWKVLKPICFGLIKGKRTPLNFKVTFHLSPENTAKFLTQTADAIGSEFSSENVTGLILNIKYDGNALTCITATSLNFFTMDKSLEHAWDDMIHKFFTQHEIAYLEE